MGAVVFCPFVVSFVRASHADEPSVSAIIVLETNQGNIELELWPAVAPKTCENMIGLVRKGYYDGTVFHRVIKGFMLQGGDPTATGRGGESFWGGKFNDEISKSVSFDTPGLLAMANAGPNTNGSQFFITTVPTPWLNGHHTIFGKVISGYDVVQKIEATKTRAGDRPVEDQKILRAYIK
ncbi:MAG: peptidylprolyl isomerase [Candidatus Omnitrophica bacterium]|nr:peptidylprolyl isomerase [Candidatus Omnitrophota bacterium]